ncbi:hypothetical protein O0I10_000030 [Lichtheimia ornata]|uniref:Amino acid transporter transmembrane domain-containing protein n=1 Tax=Lichtheimia ornata TaxID=688661 RepID=A0AAD7Y4P3_9FUNG|nr:uncharacterized protein O0I10_000030 [Lichtheimia ornata]KAJ8663757.1 hypothetical protein O0I10_000030 [Lichtheimia ornata]
MSSGGGTSHYGTAPLSTGVLPTRLSGTSLSDRVGSFVGSYSRTSLMFMAENLAVPAPSTPVFDEEADKHSTSSFGSLSRHLSGGETGGYHYQRRPSSHMESQERASLFMSEIDKMLSTHSVATVADDYRLASVLSSNPQSITPAMMDDRKKSSFAQSIFNSINILLGVGILALPLGFKVAGWAAGLLIFGFCCLLTNYTAKLLGRCLEVDPSSRTFGDLAGATFGMRGRVFVTTLFVTELITNSVAMVILLSDGLDALFPGFHSITLRIISFFILTPMLFFPVRYLSYSSLLGIISALSIIGVMFYDGFTKHDAPGSLIEPADTEIWPSQYQRLPLSFGLIMAGFASHAVFPTVYRDMDNPKRYDTMVNWTYVATTMVYLLVAVCGYLMFGSQTMQEITQNLVLVPEYNQALNRLAVWLIALQPIAKYGLNMNPVNLSWQIVVFRQPWIEAWCARGSWREPILTFIGKAMVSVMIVALAYYIPGFEKIMALLGSFFSYVISGIIPILCYLRFFGDTLTGPEKFWNWVLIIISSFMALTGTMWSFL